MYPSLINPYDVNNFAHSYSNNNISLTPLSPPQPPPIYYPPSFFLQNAPNYVSSFNSNNLNSIVFNTTTNTTINPTTTAPAFKADQKDYKQKKGKEFNKSNNNNNNKALKPFVPCVDVSSAPLLGVAPLTVDGPAVLEVKFEKKYARVCWCLCWLKIQCLYANIYIGLGL
jgi:hypothetical protein